MQCRPKQTGITWREDPLSWRCQAQERPCEGTGQAGRSDVEIVLGGKGRAENTGCQRLANTFAFRDSSVEKKGAAEILTKKKKRREKGREIQNQPHPPQTTLTGRASSNAVGHRRKWPKETLNASGEHESSVT